ncbi:MAG TPA: hypothetical protein VFK86_18355, partial [Bauldia sp.]|nr:hypothetical protein [Bauldia sp.]
DGGGGRDTLNGGRGNDMLAGETGRDGFLFSVAPGKADCDRILGFRPDKDEIRLDSDAFGGLLPGTLRKGAFFARDGARKAAGGNDRIIYDTDSGKLRYDGDGKGGEKALLFAVLDNHPDGLDHGDFAIIA